MFDKHQNEYTICFYVDEMKKLAIEMKCFAVFYFIGSVV